MAEQLKETLTDAVIATGQDIVGALQNANVGLRKTRLLNVEAHPLWVAIRERSEAIGFARHAEFIDRVFCSGGGGSTAYEQAACKDDPKEDPCKTYREEFDCIKGARAHLAHGVNAYQLLKTATEIFLMLECGVAILPPKNATTGQYDDDGDPDLPNKLVRIPDDVPEENKTWEGIASKLKEYLGDSASTPYIDLIVESKFKDEPVTNIALCAGLLKRRVACPCLLELIWSYWHEEGMLAQTFNALSLRFQNRRYPGKKIDPLAELELDPLRGINNLLWGYIQNEPHHLTVQRRAYEYEHHYGIRVLGRAVPTLRPADRRSKFIEAFHTLLNKSSVFYEADADTTVVADGFPVLNALKEVHMILAMGAHNQYGDLPWTARAEMLVQQWLLARPEIREFIGGRIMVPYPESWMGSVDSMKKLQRWSDDSALQFRNLGIFGERLLLSIRHQTWIDINDQEEARTWARYWQEEVQGYIHAYRAVSGVDLSNSEFVDSTMPAVLLRGRLAEQQRRAVTGKR